MSLSSIIGQASRGADLYFVFRFLRLLTMKYESTDAFKFGIIDNKGKALKKSADLESTKEKASYTMLHRMVFKIRRLMEKIPGGRFVNYAAALFLLKEQNNTRVWTDDVYMKTQLLEFLETDWESDAKFLKEEVDNMDKKSFKSFISEKTNIEESQKLQAMMALDDAGIEAVVNKKGKIVIDKKDKNNAEKALKTSFKKGGVPEIQYEEVELREEFSEKDFDALKKGDTITIEFKSAMSTGKSTFKVTAKNVVGKARVEKATLQNVKKPNSVKFFLYKRGNKVSLAQGDMAASVVKYTVEEVELDEAQPLIPYVSMDKGLWLAAQKGRIRFDERLADYIENAGGEGSKGHKDIWSKFKKNYGIKSMSTDEKEESDLYQKMKNMKKWEYPIKEEVEIDEAKSKLPPHLAKFFDKDGNLKKDAAARVAKGREKINWTDVTPKGYGPNDEEVEIDEAKGTAYPATIDTLRMIVKDKQNQVVMFDKGQARVDLFTASAMVQVYDALKPATKKKFEDMIKSKEGFMKSQAFAMKMIG